MDETSWSLGVLVGLPVTAAFITLGVAIIVRGLRADWEVLDLPRSAVVTFGALIVATTLAIAFGSFWPFSAEYHQWRPVAGQVAAVQSRLIGDGGGGTTQKFVVRLKDDGSEYACEDTRCSLVKVGDRVDLSCKRAWQYTGTDGWDCNYVRSSGS